MNAAPTYNVFGKNGNDGEVCKGLREQFTEDGGVSTTYSSISFLHYLYTRIQSEKMAWVKLAEPEASH